MVEVIYNEANTEMMKTENLIRLPRNIRQIGTVKEKIKVYTEDYVKSYLNQHSKENQQIGFILFGKTISARDKQYLFIDGAVSVRPEDIFHKNIEVYAEAWEKLKIAAREFFPDLEIVGWASRNDRESAEEVRRRFFSEDNKLFLQLGEGDTEYYITSSAGLQLLDGYYIYYTRNEAMQTYMIEQQEEQQSHTEVIGEPAVEQFRQIMKERKEIVKHGKMMTILSCASSFLALVVLAIGITMMNHYDKMQAMETTLVALSSSMEEKEQQQSAKANMPEKQQNIDRTDHKDIYIEETEIPKGQKQEVKEVVLMEEPLTEVQETASVSMDEHVYIVKKGDTLAGISMQFYQTRDMVDSICELNHIDNRNIILCGQKILLP